MAEEPQPAFCYPVSTLHNERITFVPFDVTKYASSFVQETAGNWDLFRFLPWGPFESSAEFEDWYQKKVGTAPGAVLFAVLVNDSEGDEKDGVDERQGTFAGTIGLLHANPEFATVEMGLIIILPRFHRTFVATNAMGLLLQFVLDAPAQGGLGLRRVQWQANTENEASIRVAKKLGFVLEGVARWERIVPSGKIGIPVGDGLREREGGAGKGIGRHSAVLALCWDDWEEKRDEVIRIMNR